VPSQKTKSTPKPPQESDENPIVREAHPELGDEVQSGADATRAVETVETEVDQQPLAQATFRVVTY